MFVKLSWDLEENHLFIYQLCYCLFMLEDIMRRWITHFLSF